MSTKDMVALEADVLLAIRHELRKNGKKGHFHHVKGHQDEEMKFSSLSREAKYKVLCDEQATTALSNKDPTKLPYKGSQAMLTINGEWITSNYEQKLTDAATTPELEKYIKEKFKWSNEDYACIDWKVIKQ